MIPLIYPRFTAFFSSFPKTKPLSLTHWSENLRNQGFLTANLDPLQLKHNTMLVNSLLAQQPQTEREISIQQGRKYFQIPSNQQISSTNDIIQLGKELYIENPFAIDASHIHSSRKNWLFQRWESTGGTPPLPNHFKKRWAQRLYAGHEFNQYLKKKFPTLKRYSHEGTDSFVPLIETLFTSLKSLGSEQCVLGMPHRGRLNILFELLGMPPGLIFAKASGHSEIPEKIHHAVGDVLSHLHISSMYVPGQPVETEFDTQVTWCPQEINSNGIRVSLVPNPSHLEAVNPVVQGKTRSIQVLLEETQDPLKLAQLSKSVPLTPAQKKVASIIVHGDAAWAGQGVVSESLQMANLDDFSVGGSIHVIVNNQVGFTAESHRSRSSVYAADIAKFIQAPIFHVNAEYPNHVAFAGALAAEYRNTFGQDIVIELHGYRRYGHNELDVPSVTQPIMYKQIDKKIPHPVEYSQSIVDIWPLEDQKKFISKLNKSFDQHFKLSRKSSESFFKNANEIEHNWKGFLSYQDIPINLSGGVSQFSKPQIDELIEIAKKTLAPPLQNQSEKSFSLHPVLSDGHTKSREKQIQDNIVDWATAEAIAFGYLLKNGHSVRISGQDVGRGTFFHRHLLLTDAETAELTIPLNDFSSKSPHGTDSSLTIANSHLSELAVFGFEHGYSANDPYTLNVLECQFGDFFTNAQTIIDQFIASSAAKWSRQSSMTILLPHGLDGAGPEHSSGRPERWLSLVNEPFHYAKKGKEPLNLQVQHLTTPSNYFASLVRQQQYLFRVPLVILTPKILLRSPECVDTFEQLAKMEFHPIYVDPSAQSCNTIVFCSGKFYYEFKKFVQPTVTIVRVEEIAPFPFQQIKDVLDQNPTAQCVWVQEEHENQGYYHHILPRFHTMDRSISLISRAASAVPATGNSKSFKSEKASLLESISELGGV